MAARAKTEKKNDIVVAKTDDGTIQIMFTIPYATVSTERNKVENELIKDINVPGFRKGKAPLEKAIEKVPESTIIEHTLQHILPTLLAKAINENKLRPALYPKFELVKAEPNEPWEVRATTAEMPQAELGNYEEKIKAESKTGSIWMPGKDTEVKEPSPEQKQQIVIKALLENTKLTIPKLLIDEETNSRLSQLLERIERLGLSLESYLTSVGKNVQNIRTEYEKQSKDTLALDIILSQIANEKDITVAQTDIDAALSASSADSKLAQELNTPEQRRMIESILKKRKALELLTSLV